MDLRIESRQRSACSVDNDIIDTLRRCYKDPFSSATPYAEELENYIDLLIHYRTYANVIFQAIKIELKIVMKKNLIAAMRKVNLFQSLIFY